MTRSASLLVALALPLLWLLSAWIRRPTAIRARPLAIFAVLCAGVAAWVGISALGSLGSTMAFGSALVLALGVYSRRRDVLLLFSPSPSAPLRGLMRRLAIDYVENGAEWRIPKYGGRLRVFTFFPNCYWVSLSVERVTPKIELLTTLMRKFLANPNITATKVPKGES